MIEAIGQAFVANVARDKMLASKAAGKPDKAAQREFDYAMRYADSVIGLRALQRHREIKDTLVRPADPVGAAADILGKNIRSRINNPDLVATTKLQGKKHKVEREKALLVTAHMAGASAGLNRSRDYAAGIHNVSGHPDPRVPVIAQVMGRHAQEILRNPNFNEKHAGYRIPTYNSAMRATWSPEDPASQLYSDVRALQFLTAMGADGAKDIEADPRRASDYVVDVMQNMTPQMPDRNYLEYLAQFAPPEPRSQP